MVTIAAPSVQQRFAPASRCFGCGPANELGLRLESRPGDEGLVASWMPAAHHEAFAGVLNGGIIGALLDCHSNWAAAWHLMQRGGLPQPPATVTAEYHVKLRRPTPTAVPIDLIARVVDSREDQVVVEAELLANGKVCATCRGTFVAVKPGHPAYHRW